MKREEAYRCKKYIKGKKDELVRVGNWLIDTKALLTPCNLDCFRCHLVHRETCCENGQPYAVDSWQIPLLENEASTIAGSYLDAGAIRKIEQKGIWDKGKGESEGSLQQHRGSCLFSTVLNGNRCCSIHAHAEKNKKEVYPIKPFSCQLYPLELIRIGDLILITALSEETAPFSRWGTDYLETFYCANLKRRKEASFLDPELFRIDEYVPAYRWGKYLIEQALGIEAFEAVEEAIQAMVYYK